MIPRQTAETSVAVGFAEKNNFSIKTNAKAFKILSSSIYQDKLSAVVRELATNAQDSHIDAGVPEKAFTIKMPDRLDPEFKIRDYGTGLSHENVMNLYSTYFESTKESSNDGTGMLGLGSKSPLSIVDSFNVVSYFNGKKSTYVAFIGDNGMPSIMFAGAIDTDEPNGVQVSFVFDVKSEVTYIADRQYFEFAQKAAKVLYWMDTPVDFQCSYITNQNKMSSYSLPGIRNWREIFDDTEDLSQKAYNREFNMVSTVVGDDKSWAIYYPITSMIPRDANVCVKQGPLVYPVEEHLLLERIDDQERASKVKEMLKKDIILFAPMGTVDFDPGREDLEYQDEGTVEFVVSTLIKIYDRCLVEIEKALSTPMTPWQRAIKFREYSKNWHITHRGLKLQARNWVFMPSSSTTILSDMLKKKSLPMIDFNSKVELVPDVKIYRVYGRSSNTRDLFEYAEEKKDSNGAIVRKARTEVELKDIVGYSPENVKFYIYTKSKNGITVFASSDRVKGSWERFGNYTEIALFGNDVDAIKQQIKNFGSPEFEDVTNTLNVTKIKHTTAQYMTAICYYEDLKLPSMDKEFDDIADIEGIYIYANAFNDWSSTYAEDGKPRNLKNTRPLDYFQLFYWAEKIAPLSFAKMGDIKIIRCRDKHKVDENKDLQHFDEYFPTLIKDIKKETKDVILLEFFDKREVGDLMNFAASVKMDDLILKKTRELFQEVANTVQPKIKAVFDGGKKHELTTKARNMRTFLSNLSTYIEAHDPDIVKNFTKDSSKEAEELIKPVNQLMERYRPLKDLSAFQHYLYRTADNSQRHSQQATYDSTIQMINALDMLDVYNKKQAEQQNEKNS